MNLFDIEGLVIADGQGEILYRKTFGEDMTRMVVEKVLRDKESILIAADRLVLSKRLDDVFLVMYCPLDANEPFMGQVFEEFAAAFVEIVKTPTRDRVWKKYDQIVLLVAGFVYEGIVICGKSEEMTGRLPKRNFEGVDGMKVPRGFASLLHKATKSFSLINK